MLCRNPHRHMGLRLFTLKFVLLYNRICIRKYTFDTEFTVLRPMCKNVINGLKKRKTKRIRDDRIQRMKKYLNGHSFYNANNDCSNKNSFS